MFRRARYVMMKDVANRDDGTIDAINDYINDYRMTYGKSPFDTRRAILDIWGSDACDFAVSLSKRPFAEFKEGMRSIGFPALTEDEPNGIREGSVPIGLGRIPRLANAVLCLRYPFLVPRSRWSGDVIWYEDMDEALYDESREHVQSQDAFSTTELDALPIGWLARFGLEICEDLKSVLGGTKLVGNPMDYYRIDQIKEKWGTLRWYSNGAPGDVYDDEFRLMDLYERISSRVCIGCGGCDRVRVTGGWVSYQCFNCRYNHATSRSPMPDEKVVSHYNRMIDIGRLREVIGGLPRLWQEANGFAGEDGVPTEHATKAWDVPYALKGLVMRDILDGSSRAVGSIEHDRVLVLHSWSPDDDEPETEEIDLFDWADGKGLLAADLARSVDRMRRGFDGGTNNPKGQSDDGQADDNLLA